MWHLIAFHVLCQIPLAKKQKTGCLAEKAKWHLTHLYALLQCKPSLVVSLSYLWSPISLQILVLWMAELENNKNRCSNFGCSSLMHLCSKSTFSIIRSDFSFLNLIVSRPLRIIVDIITSRAAACFHTKAELWRAKMKFLHYQACFLFYHAHTAWLSPTLSRVMTAHTWSPSTWSCLVALAWTSPAPSTVGTLPPANTACPYHLLLIFDL